MIGQTLAHYHIIARLGAGGMGEVWRATDTRLGRDVALKILPRAFTADAGRLARFQREARALAALDHPNIVTVHSIEQAGDLHFLTMSIVHGSTLDHSLRPGGMPLEELLGIAVPLCNALASAHDHGIVHRDLKPGNVMVAADGRVKVLDFGLAKFAGSTPDGPDADTMTQPLTREGAFVGTLPYMSPEQLEGLEVDHRADLFSLGVMLYEMATGVRPFQGQSHASLASSILRDEPRPLTSLRAGLPAALARIVSRCLEKDRGRRSASAHEISSGLEQLVGAATPAALEPEARSVAVLPRPIYLAIPPRSTSPTA